MKTLNFRATIVRRLCCLGILFFLGTDAIRAQDEATAIPLSQGFAKVWAGSDDASLTLSDEGIVEIDASSPTDSSWTTLVPVRPSAEYRLSAKIKTENVEKTTGVGALINVHEIYSARSTGLIGTNGWTDVSINFINDDRSEITVNCLLGGWGNASGKASYKDLRLEFVREIKTIPDVAGWNPTIKIDASQKSEPISPYIYGQFIEHLGRCIYGGIWAETLQDRKFFDPVGGEASPWKILKTDNSQPCVSTEVQIADVMDEKEPFVGKWSPNLRGDGELGIEQGNLKFKQGKYIGYFWAKASPEIQWIAVEIGLDPDDVFFTQVFKPEVFNEYQKYEFEFDCDKNRDGKDDDVRFYLGRDSNGDDGSLTIGCVSLMPGDNQNGMRADTLQLLRELNSPVYRWPGGNFVSGYDWKDGIGDRDRRPPRKNPAWQGIESNDFGFDEFMAFCKTLNTEPYIAINTGNGDVANALAELEYANGSAETPFGKLRATNGNADSYGVKFWCVGNEMYGDWQIGHIPVADYVKRHNEFVDALRAQDSNIIVVGVGSVGGWNDTFIPGAFDRLDYLSEHFYTQNRSNILEHIRLPIDAIRHITNAHREYRNRWPELYQKHDLRVVMDEWNYWYGPHAFGELGTRYFLRDGLGIAAGLHEFYRNSDVYFMANYAQTVNVIGAIKTNETAAQFESTGLVLKLYRQEFGSIPVDAQISSNKEVADGILNVSAALSDDGKYLTVACVNAASDPVSAKLEWDGVSIEKNGRKFVISDKENDPYAYNDPSEPRRIDIAESSIALENGEIVFAPLSVTLLKFPIER